MMRVETTRLVDVQIIYQTVCEILKMDDEDDDDNEEDDEDDDDDDGNQGYM